MLFQYALIAMLLSTCSQDMLFFHHMQIARAHSIQKSCLVNLIIIIINYIQFNVVFQTAVLCQFAGGNGSDCDYATAFRALEERNSNDSMDELYDFIWDVTLLEYIVSMHAKRGELSRTRRALEIISRVEININNNEEILREARASRRSRFLRHLCSVFL